MLLVATYEYCASSSTYMYTLDFFGQKTGHYILSFRKYQVVMYRVRPALHRHAEASN